MVVPRDVGFSGRGLHLVLASTIGPAIATLLVVNRVYVRWRQSNLAWDDYASLSGLSFLYAHATVNIAGVNFGYGRPAATLSPTDLRKALLCFYLCQIFYKLSINTTKISICFLYLRVFPQVRWFCRLSWSLVLIIACYMFSSVFATIFQCYPISLAWTPHSTSSTITTSTSTSTTTIPTLNPPDTHPEHCIDLTAFWNTTATFNVLTTLILLISVPIVVWSPSLTLPRRSKLDLTPVFLLGLFDLATAILRFTTLTTSSHSGDPTAGSFVSTLWTVVEASTAIVCACAPMVRNTVRLHRESLKKLNLGWGGCGYGGRGRRDGERSGYTGRRSRQGRRLSGGGLTRSDDAETLTSPTFGMRFDGQREGSGSANSFVDVLPMEDQRMQLGQAVEETDVRRPDQREDDWRETDQGRSMGDGCTCGVCWGCNTRAWQKHGKSDIGRTFEVEMDPRVKTPREVEEIEMTITTPRSARTLVEHERCDGGLGKGRSDMWKDF